MFFSLKKKLSTFVFIMAFVFVVFVLLPMEQIDAQAGVPLGGTISYVTYCTCSFNYLLTVVGPSPGNFVFQPGASVPFPYGQVYRPGPFVLGTYTTGGICLMYAGYFCYALPSNGTITMIGTSL